MTQRVDKVALGRRGAANALLALLLAAPALAGDRAQFDPIGYSADGRYFAFEEFGISDGAGFAYSTVFVVDLQKDAWVSGTPVRAQADSEDTALGAIRSEARDEAETTLSSLEIDQPAQILALIGDGVPDATTDAQTLGFGLPGYQAGVAEGDYRLALESFASSSPLTCADWFGSEPLGFALTLSMGDGAPRDVHRDGAKLPESRGCPLGYRLYGVLAPIYGQDLQSVVAIVSNYPGGFEGPDRRFIAVPLAP